jgi:NAD(P)-dependent dehydrogenase (short-subunit alcohol dehydrogenase family)
MDITDTTAIVTGAASGLGAATAEAMAEAGAHVYAFDLPSALETAPERKGIAYLPVDVTVPEQIRDAMTEVTASGLPLRSVVNCAGIGPSARILSRKGPHNLALYARTIQVNLIGTFNVLIYAAEKIAETEALDDGSRGVVINTASIAAFDGQIGQVAYSSSKGGIVGMTLPAARDLAQYGIRVNTIAPGIVETPMLATFPDEVRTRLAAGIPFPQRLARPREFAQLALFMIGHEYLNGETVRMDGALRMAPR